MKLTTDMIRYARLQSPDIMKGPSPRQLDPVHIPLTPCHGPQLEAGTAWHSMTPKPALPTPTHFSMLVKVFARVGTSKLLL